MVELPTIQDTASGDAQPTAPTTQTVSRRAVPAIWLRAGLLVTPVISVLLTVAAGVVVLPLAHRPVHADEMLWAGGVMLAVGWLAVLPMAILIGRGAILLLRCAMFANMARLIGSAGGSVLVLVLAPVPLHKTVLILWLAAYYFVLLIAESFTSSWVIKHSSVH